MAEKTFRLDARGVQEGIKRGLCMEDFCEKYGVDREEFLKQLKRLYPYNHVDMAKKISKAGKRRAKSRGPVNVEKTMAFIVKQGEAPNSVPDPVPETTEEKLARLEREAEEQSQVVIDLEVQRKKLQTSHRECVSTLRGIRDELEELRQQFAAKSNEYEEVVQKNNQIIRGINELSNKRREEVKKLEELRTTIENLQVITLEIYTSGEIKVDDGSELEPENEVVEQLFSKLVVDPICEDLRVRDIRILAQVLAIRQGTTRNLEFVFEDDELEQVFYSIEGR